MLYLTVRVFEEAELRFRVSEVFVMIDVWVGVVGA
jgi:hypothetical protein